MIHTAQVTWDNRNAAPRCVNTMRPLTPALDLGEEGLAMQATRTCIIEDCGKPHRARGLCHSHYSQFTRQGTIDDYPPVGPQGHPPCTICGKPVWARGLCQMHYTRQRRTGSVDLRPYDREAAVRRFWARVDRCADNECWPWLGTILNTGYGQVTIGGKRQMAHCAAYELAVGPIPPGYQIDHVRARGCVRLDCVNPAHLEAVTPRENNLRSTGPSALNARKTECPRCGSAYESGSDGTRFCRRCRNAWNRDHDKR